MYEGFLTDIPPSRHFYYLMAKGALPVGLCEEKNKKTEEIIKALKECLEVNLSFWINNFEAGRLTDAALLKIQKTLNLENGL